MAKRKSDKPRKEREPKDAAPSFQALSDDQLQVLFFQHKKQYEAHLATKKKADADLKNACKLAKSELGKNAVDRIKLAITLDTDEGDAALKEKIEGELQVARWMGSSVGTQFEMALDGQDRTPATDRAFDDGKRDGLAGNPCHPVFAPETEQYRRYMAGFHEGQEVLAKGFKKPAADDGDVRPNFLKASDNVGTLAN